MSVELLYVLSFSISPHMYTMACELYVSLYITLPKNFSLIPENIHPRQHKSTCKLVSNLFSINIIYFLKKLNYLLNFIS